MKFRQWFCSHLKFDSFKYVGLAFSDEIWDLFSGSQLSLLKYHKLTNASSLELSEVSATARGVVDFVYVWFSLQKIYIFFKRF